MRAKRFLRATLCCIAVVVSLHALGRPFREYPGVEYTPGDIPLPADYQDQTEFTFARLMFPGGGLDDGYYPRFQGDYRLGRSLWTQDYPRADRYFADGVRRLTGIDIRSVEQVTDLDSDDIFNWPWVYAVQVGEWGVTEAEAQVLREYLLRGGFFMADDLHGEYEWQLFTRTMKMAFPEREIVDIPDEDAVFHAFYDLDERFQVPGWAHLARGFKSPIHATGPEDGKGAHWRGIYDDDGRLMVAVSYNSDLGDAWEWADDARYPSDRATLAIRVGINNIIYAMTH